MENNGKQRKTVGDGGDGGGRSFTQMRGASYGKTGRDDRMPSVLVFDSYLSGNFRK